MDVAAVAKLANLALTPDQIASLGASLNTVIKLIDHIQQLDAVNVEPTSQVTGLVNVTRPDIIDPSRVLTQKQALSMAKSTLNGYFKVPAIFD